MKKLITKFTTYLLFGLVSMPFADAGKGSHGGGAFVCFGDNNEVISAVSQDIWEGENQDFLSFSRTSTLDEVSLAEAAIEKIKPINTVFYEHLKIHFQNTIKLKEILDLKIQQTNDDYRSFEMFDCKNGKPEFSQAAVYLDRTEFRQKERVIISKPIWNRFTTLDRAALLLHEAIYTYFRFGYEEKNSVRTRLLVADLLSDSSEINNKTLIPEGCRVNPENGNCESQIEVTLEFLELPPPYMSVWMGISPIVAGVYSQERMLVGRLQPIQTDSNTTKYSANFKLPASQVEGALTRIQWEAHENNQDISYRMTIRVNGEIELIRTDKHRYEASFHTIQMAKPWML